MKGFRSFWKPESLVSFFLANDTFQNKLEETSSPPSILLRKGDAVVIKTKYAKFRCESFLAPASNFRRQCCTLDNKRDFSGLRVITIPAVHPGFLEFVQENDRVHDVADTFSLVLVFLR